MSMDLDSLTPEQAVKKWNESWPVGTRVRYWKASREAAPRIYITRAEAAVVAKKAVVWLRGVYGSVPLTKVEPVPPPFELGEEG